MSATFDIVISCVVKTILKCSFLELGNVITEKYTEPKALVFLKKYKTLY